VVCNFTQLTENSLGCTGVMQKGQAPGLVNGFFFLEKKKMEGEPAVYELGGDSEIRPNYGTEYWANLGENSGPPNRVIFGYSSGRKRFHENPLFGQIQLSIEVLAAHPIYWGLFGGGIGRGYIRQLFGSEFIPNFGRMLWA